MTDLIIFLSYESHEPAWKGWDALQNSYCIVKAKVRSEKKEIGRVIFIDEPNYGAAIRAFVQENESFDNRTLLIQHTATKFNIRNSQKAAVETSPTNGVSSSSTMEGYTKTPGESPWKAIKQLADKAEQLDIKKVEDGEATIFAGELFVKYDFQLNFHLLDQITAKLILKSFNKETEGFSKLENIFIEKEGRWLKNVCDQDSLNPDSLNGFLKIANEEAKEYLEEINPQ